jgi:hypothetical protein
MSQVAIDGSTVVSYITRFTKESFATLVSLIFMSTALEKVFDLMSVESYAIYNPVS